MLEAIETMLKTNGQPVVSTDESRIALATMLNTFTRQFSTNQERILTPEQRRNMIAAIALDRSFKDGHDVTFIKDAVFHGYAGWENEPDIQILLDAIVDSPVFYPVSEAILAGDISDLAIANSLMEVMADTNIMHRNDITSQLNPALIDDIAIGVQAILLAVENSAIPQIQIDEFTAKADQVTALLQSDAMRQEELDGERA